MKTRKTMLTALVVLAMVLTLLPGAACAAAEAQAPYIRAWGPTDIQVEAVEGQEYAIAPKDTDPDWSKTVAPEDGAVNFWDLTPATAYVIYTRVQAAGGSAAGEPKTANLTTPLSSIGITSETDTVVGGTLVVTPDPEDAAGLTYQWYYDDVVPEGDGERHNLTPIEGATEPTYQMTEADLGKYLSVKIFLGEEEVADLTDPWGPVVAAGDQPVPTAMEDCARDASCPIRPFTDAQPDAWYHDGVHWALENGVMKGVGDTLFAPDGTATRAMVVTMLWRLLGEPEAAQAAPFSDVPADAWYAGAVAWAAENGAVTGVSATEFAPDTPVTREQMAAILYRCAQALGQGFTGTWAFHLDYPDAEEISEYAYEPLCWMTMQSVIQGTDGGRLAPKDNATRAQIATMFLRFAALM